MIFELTARQEKQLNYGLDKIQLGKQRKPPTKSRKIFNIPSQM
jgi:hypothetical protein